MSSVQLLDKIRKIGKLLHNNNSSKVLFSDICSVLRDTLSSNVLVISRKGKVLGVGNLASESDILHEMIKNEVGSFIDPALNERLLSVLSTKENVNLATLGFMDTGIRRFTAVITPVEISGERYGTMFLYRDGEEYGLEDIILCEHGVTVVELEMLRSVSEEKAEEKRKQSVIQAAVSTLSYSETQAIVHIFEELRGKEGILVASKIADSMGITRSVTVNALRKLESAGIIESRSAGMKGTCIRVKNDMFFQEVDRLKERLRKSS